MRDFFSKRYTFMRDFFLNCHTFMRDIVKIEGVPLGRGKVRFSALRLLLTIRNLKKVIPRMGWERATFQFVFIAL